MHAGEVGARECRVADLGAGAVDEVDHARRQAGFLEELHQEVRGVRRRRRWLPDDRVAHQRRARREVPADRREVERRDGEDEALERPVLHPVPGPGRGVRLLVVDAQHELHVEAEEVRQLARRVDLGLVRGLRLPEHGRGVERRAPGPGEELGRSEQDRGAVLPRRSVPVLPGLACGLDRLVDMSRVALVHLASTWSLSCGMTASNVSRVRTSSPPMTSGRSICSERICSSRTRSSSRSGVPGA